MSKKYGMKIIFAFVVSLCSLLVQSQTINLINYNEAPSMYNPAMLSNINRAQVILNYRNNRFSNDVSDFSSMISLHLPLGLYFDKLNLGNIGVSAFDEHSNYSPSIRNTGIAFAYSQPIPLSDRSFFSLGLQCYIFQKRLDMHSFTTGSQWDDNLGYNPSLPNGENQFENKLNGFSINSGIYWQRNENNKRKVFGGLSVFNLNRPGESFTGTGTRQPLRYFMSGGYTFADNNIGSFAMDALCSVQEKQTIAGIGVKAGLYYLTGGSGIGEVNVYSRMNTNNTLVAGAMLVQNWFTCGISYDFSMSSAFNADNRSNAFEIFLKIRFGRTVKSKNVPVVATTNYHKGQTRVFAEERKTEVIESSTPDATAFKRVETVSDTSNSKFVPVKLALKRDFKFAFNDATLSNEAKAYLDELTGLMKRNKNITLEIIGHTDDVGNKEGNLKISVLRAKVVADYLESMGIDNKRLSITGKMDTEPLFPNTTPENRARNRRVEFIIQN